MTFIYVSCFFVWAKNLRCICYDDLMIKHPHVLKAAEVLGVEALEPFRSPTRGEAEKTNQCLEGT